MEKLIILTSEDERNRYRLAILALLKRVEVAEGDKVIKKELGPVYQLLELLNGTMPDEMSKER